MTVRNTNLSLSTTATTARRFVAFEVDAEQYELLMVKDGVVTVRALPPSGEIIIGRADECDVQIDKLSVSRRHARLCIGNPITIADLDSVNGVKVKDQYIPPGRETEIAVGEVIEIGAVIMFLLQPKKSVTAKNVLDKEEYRKQFQLLFDQSNHKTSTFGILRIRCKQWTSREPLPTITSILKESDLVGVLEPRMFEILFLNRTNAEVEKASQSICKTLIQSGFEILTSQALYPRDGRKRETLEAKISRLYMYGQPPQRTKKSVVVVNPKMIRLYETIEKIAPSNLNVLITGETGVGKEVIAETVHKLSHRADQQLVRINCAAIPETLLESELFGFERGAFTGAERTKIGLLELANRGTVFLDEIGDISLSLQVKLLRVLEEKKIFRVGGVAPRKIDVRFIAATNLNLWRATSVGKFRSDLYYRLNGVTLQVPPLRERKDEIEPLALECIRHFCACSGRDPVSCLSADVIWCLRNHCWPGNIRELENVIENALLMSGGCPIELEHLSIANSDTKSDVFSIGSEQRARLERVLKDDSINQRASVTKQSAESGLPFADRFKHEVIDLERKIIIEALQRCAGNQTRASKMLGISRRTLIKRLNEYKIEYGRRRKKSLV